MSFFEASVRANTTQFVKDIKTVAEKTTVTVRLKPEGGTEQLTTSMKKTIDSAGTLTTSIKKVNNAGDELTKTTITSSKAVKSLGQDFVDTFGKVAKFGAITSIIGLFTKAMYEAVQVVKNMDNVQTEFKKVSDLSGESLSNYTEKLGLLGDEIARTRSEMLSASTEFVKSGYTEEQSAQLAKVAGLYQNVADSEISAGDASSYVISQMKAFKISAEDATSIIDKTNEVDILAFPIGNFWVIKDNYIGQILGIEETEERRFDKIKVDSFNKICYNILLRNRRIIIT